MQQAAKQLSGTNMSEYYQELAIMRDSLKIGIFFMDRNFIIQNNYSGYLGAMFSNPDLAGLNFLDDILSPCVTHSELDAIKDYFNMIFEGSHEQYIIDEINPLLEFEYTPKGAPKRKIYQFSFAAIQKGSGEVFALVTVNDITSSVELRKQLREEENRRHEEMRAVFELIQIEPHVLDDFIEDMEYEFDEINNTLMNNKLSSQEILVKVYQSVHSIKSNAFTLEQNTFGNKVHKIETKIKQLREKDEVSFKDMLGLTMDIEKLTIHKENFKSTRERIKSHKVNENFEGENKSQQLLLNSLSKTVNRVSQDLGKKVKIVADEIEIADVNKELRRVIKDILIQLLRNSVVHGIETPKERIAAKKDETGLINISIKTADDKVHVKLSDNGKGFDFNKIAEKALQLKMIKPEEKTNKEKLLSIVFSPGFSTAQEEGIHSGRGIGLNMVRDRIQEYKGTFKIQSETGKRTEFNICFPLADTQCK